MLGLATLLAVPASAANNNNNAAPIALLKAGQEVARTAISSLYPNTPAEAFWLLASFSGEPPVPRAGFLLLGLDEEKDLAAPGYDGAIVFLQSEADAQAGVLRVRMMGSGGVVGVPLGEVRIEGFVGDGKGVEIAMREEAGSGSGRGRGRGMGLREALMKRVERVEGWVELDMGR
ncbi:MAG: hypothetical protein M1829_001039 [Trizodia sp. TS-e1964]|nr:MAG: hypothetical protein M1829_001039 [Trizodia sp. TS-e1964]